MRRFSSQSFFSTCLLLLLTFPPLARLLFDYLNDGQAWRQGEWLINFGSGTIRRGVIGEGLIAFSDLSNLPLITVTIGVQVALLIAAVIMLWYAWRRCQNRILFAWLLVSPAFFLFQWAGDVQGIMRKEVLTYLALALLAIASAGPQASAGLTSLAVFVFCFACFGNILNAFAVLAFVVGVWFLFLQNKINARFCTASIVVACGAAVCSVLFAMAYKEVPDHAGMCAKLLSRGLDQNICDGALFWLVTDEVDHAAEVAIRRTPAAVTQWAAVSVLSLIPAALLLRYIVEKPTFIGLGIVAFVPIIPLYILATDWGRWFSFSYTCFAVLIILAHACGRLALTRTLPIWPTYGMLLVCLVLTHASSIGWQPGGVAVSFTKAITDIL